MGVGAAMTGLRPIVEGMNMGFLLLAFNQISNNCGMLHYTSGGQYKTPLVIRGPGGVGRQLGAEHSQRLESYFQSIPGVQLVAVSTVRNSKALLKAVRVRGLWGAAFIAAPKAATLHAARAAMCACMCRPSAATTPSFSSSTCCSTTSRARCDVCKANRS
jgi:hypothetical protein